MQLDILNLLEQLISRCISIPTHRLHHSSLDKLFPAAQTDFGALINHYGMHSLNTYFKYCKTSTITHIITPFCTNYCILCLSKEDDEHLLLGPFLEKQLSDSMCYSITSNLNLSLNFASDFKCYYQSLTTIDVAQLVELLHIIHTYITKTHTLLHTISIDLSTLPKSDTSYDLLSQHMNRTAMYKMLENRYLQEAQIMEAIANADITRARTLWQDFSALSQPIIRTDNSLRNTKNLTIIANTLFRKATQAGGVHPIYIDELSSKWALKIEQATSVEVLNNMPLQMIRAYCLLVKNHSLAHYSPIIQHALTYINLNIVSSLSVKEVAAEIGISPDYLTRLFKKELGSPVITYINNTRIQSSIKLLNTTDLSIQEIGELVGLSDTSYFDKLFKKYIGMSPKQYRDSIRNTYHET